MGIANYRVLCRLYLKRVVCRARWPIGGNVARRAGTLAPVLDECVEFCLRRLRGDAVFQSPNDMEYVEAAVLTNGRREPERQPDCRVVVHDIDAGWHDPKDFVKPTVDIHCLSDERLTSKDRLPQLVRNNRERWRQPPGTTRFFRGEESSLRWLNAKRAEETRVDRDRPHAERPTARREVDLAGRVSSARGSVRPDRSKRLIDLPELQVLLHRERVPGQSELREFRCHKHQL